MKTNLIFPTLLFLLLGTTLHAQDEIPRIRIVHGPYLQNVVADEATIVWLSDKPSVGWVELAADDGSNFYAVEHPRHFDALHGVKRTSTVHVVRLEGLRSGTRYRYRVFVQEVLQHVGHKIVYGSYASTDVYGRKPLCFRTADPGARETSFAVVNDIHARNDLLTDLVAQCDLGRTDFFIFNGDMVSVFNEEEDIFQGFMDTATRLFASEIPMYYARGNHETRGAFATEIQHYFSPLQPHLYYTFRQGPVLFVVLDTGEDKPDSDIEYAGITVYDEYRTRQARWLAETLQSREYREAPFKVVIAHIPPTDEGWHGNLEVERKFMPLLRQSPPDLMLCGHLHYFVHHDANACTPFPIVVNSNTSLLRVHAGDDGMQVEVTERDGKLLDKFVIPMRK